MPAGRQDHIPLLELPPTDGLAIGLGVGTAVGLALGPPGRTPPPKVVVDLEVEMALG